MSTVWLPSAFHPIEYDYCKYVTALSFGTILGTIKQIKVTVKGNEKDKN